VISKQNREEVQEVEESPNPDEEAPNE
jgi:hypothetical protein